MTLPVIPASAPSFFDNATVANDFEVIDDLEGAWYYIRYEDSPPLTNDANAIPIPNMFRPGRTQGQVANDYLQVNNTTWHLWTTQMPTMVGPTNPATGQPYWASPFIPCQYDLIYAPFDDSIWVVDRVDIVTFNSRYRLTCTRFVTN